MHKLEGTEKHLIWHSLLVLIQLDIFSNKLNAYQFFEWFKMNVLDRISNFSNLKKTSTRKNAIEINKIKLTDGVKFYT